MSSENGRCAELEGHSEIEGHAPAWREPRMRRTAAPSDREPKRKGFPPSQLMFF